MEETVVWYSFTAALILESLHSCSTDRKLPSPLSRDRYITAVELSGVYLHSREWYFLPLYQSI